MPQVINPPTRTLPPGELPRLKWNAEQYENLFTMGLLPEKGYELIEGDVVEKMPIKDPHALVIALLFEIFGLAFGFRALRSQFTLAINEHNLPEPDFAVLTTPNPTLSERHYIQVAGVRLLVEVSDATLSHDLTRKARLYAQASVPEYWVVDVVGRRLLIHTKPGADGYALDTQYDENEIAAPLFAPLAAFVVSDILP